MKIKCDVCDKEEASVFCVADEAALCAACDHGVHHANKLAGKHHRFSLHYPSSSKQAPVCDICQDKRAFLFCRQDRAIMCKDCDISVHKANENTRKHARFLLTGVKLSATSSLYSASKSSSESACNVPDPVPTVIQSTCAAAATDSLDYHKNESMPTSSSISEYLMETLPGWHVEDFLDSASPHLPYSGFSKNGGGDENNEMLTFLDGGVDRNLSGFPAAESMGFWVTQNYQSMDIAFGARNSDGFKEQSREFTINSSKWSEDSCFAVPQMSTPSNASKRYRTFW